MKESRSKTIKDRLEKTFRRIFRRSDLQLAENTTAKDILGWDSLTHIVLIVSIEAEFQIRFTTKELLDLKNVGELLTLISKKTKIGEI